MGQVADERGSLCKTEPSLTACSSLPLARASVLATRTPPCSCATPMLVTTNMRSIRVNGLSTTTIWASMSSYGTTEDMDILPSLSLPRYRSKTE